MDQKTMDVIKAVFDDLESEAMLTASDAANHLLAIQDLLMRVTGTEIKICEVMVMVQQYARFGNFDTASVRPNDAPTKGDIAALWITTSASLGR